MKMDTKNYMESLINSMDLNSLLEYTEKDISGESVAHDASKLKDDEFDKFMNELKKDPRYKKVNRGSKLDSLLS